MLFPWLLLALTATSGFAAKDAKDKPMNKKELTAAVNDLSATVTRLEQLFNSLEERFDKQADKTFNPIGFTVRVRAYTNKNLAVGTVIKFDDVRFNAGNGYNTNTGVFTAPEAGVYAVFLETMGPPFTSTTERIIMDIMKNVAEPLGRAHAGFYMYENGGSGLILVNLDLGDTLHVKIAAGREFIGDHYTVFSAFKLC